MEKTMYVVMKNRCFLDRSYGIGMWFAEYPSASIFDSALKAKQAARQVARRDQNEIIRVVANPGMENEIEHKAYIYRDGRMFEC